MISQINTRLISSRIITTNPSTITSGYASSGSDSSSRRSSGSDTGVNHNGAPSKAIESSSTGSSNGYAADNSAHPSLPTSINGATSTKRSGDTKPSSSQPALKRLRTRYNDAELKHLASNAKTLIEQAGLVYPKLQTNRSRIFPPKSGVDMSGVTHTLSSQYKSPFLVDNAMFTKNYMQCPHELTSLLQSTSSYYSLNRNDKVLPSSFVKVVQMIKQNQIENTPMINKYGHETFSDTGSSTSSVTVSDTGLYNRSSNSDHSDGTLLDSQRNSFNTSKSDALVNKNHQDRTLVGTSIISIGEALEISRRPRIITLAQAPYNVVQVNAAFLRFMHSKSTNDFLGKPLEDFMQMMNEDSAISSFASGLDASYKTMQKISVPGNSNIFHTSKTTSTTHHRNDTNNVRHISIIPVGVKSDTTTTTTTIDGKVTHFAIKFSIQQDRSLSCTSSTTTSSSSISPLNKTNDAINVIG